MYAPAGLKHLIGFRRDRRESVFLFVRPTANRRLGQVNAAGRPYAAALGRLGWAVDNVLLYGTGAAGEGSPLRRAPAPMLTTEAAGVS
jgi:hypothetical protein